MADNYRKEQIKENLPGFKQGNSISDNKGSNLQLSEEGSKDLVGISKPNIVSSKVFEEKHPNNLKQSNLNKRIPSVKSNQFKITKNQPYEIETKLNIQKKEEIKNTDKPKPITEEIKTIKNVVHPMESINILTFDTIEMSENMKFADRLAEKLSMARDQRNSFSEEDIRLLLLRVCQFCEFCNQVSDEDLKILVKQRLGSYLNAMSHLIDEIPELQAATSAAARAALGSLFSATVRKTLGFVGVSH